MPDEYVPDEDRVPSPSEQKLGEIVQELKNRAAVSAEKVDTFIT